MSDQTATSQADSRALAEQVYNMLMADIETDLLLGNIHTLDRAYSGESPKEHEARMQRYAAAYKRFDEAFNEFMNSVNGNVRATQRNALKSKEEQAKSEEKTTLTSLASAFADMATADKSAFN